MDESKKSRPPRELISTISLMKWKPDQQALEVALGKKPDKKNGRGTGN